MRILSGIPVLADDARNNLLTWRFSPTLTAGTDVEIVYVYQLHEPAVYGPVASSVTIESPTRVVITANLPGR